MWQASLVGFLWVQIILALKASHANPIPRLRCNQLLGKADRKDPLMTDKHTEILECMQLCAQYAAACTGAPCSLVDHKVALYIGPRVHHGAQCKSMVHNVALYCWSGAQRRFHNFRQTDGTKHWSWNIVVHQWKDLTSNVHCFPYGTARTIMISLELCILDIILCITVDSIIPVYQELFNWTVTLNFTSIFAFSPR